jgi:phosphate/sulfate permease
MREPTASEPRVASYVRPMDAGLVVAISAALAFALTNGIHDASNAIATLVATRAARPKSAILLAAACNPPSGAPRS